MDEEKQKIILPEELQEKMMDFFLKTSIPRRKKRLEQKKQRVLSENETFADRSGKNENGNTETDIS